ncbi:MAG: hypothetical protein RDU20_17505 [Desulfomonilaceae bacterium]|nr:hypothetical protein [Desulfomonilaceae bacterium]
MSNGDQKDFLDFIREVTKDQQLAQKFLEVINKDDVKAEDLRTFFQAAGYGGVSIADCEKVLAVKPPEPGKVEIDGVTVKY